MKTIEELGISPTPWSVESYDTADTHYVVDFTDHEVVMFGKDGRRGKANARLVAAAPKLYECLLNAVIDRCCDCLNHVGWTCESDEDCPVKKWRAALAEAAGEEAFDE